MNGTSSKDRLAGRLADAYGLTMDDAQTAVAGLAAEIAEDVAFERHGGDVLLVDGGEVVATLSLGDVLPPIAPACDTLDPYGDREDVLITHA